MDTHLPGPTHEELEHVELAAGQVDLGCRSTTTRRPVSSTRSWPTTDGDRVTPAGAAQQGADPGDQDRERERLGEVVVGAGVERLGLVEVAVLGRQHQDRRPVAGRPQVARTPRSRCAGAA